MKLEVLVSTMAQEDYSLFERMNLSSDCVVVNQCGREFVADLNMKGNSVKWIDSAGTGLSRSRNLAIDNSVADVCVIADDDLVYIDGYDERILNAFHCYKDADVLAFIVEGKNGFFKDYGERPKKLNFLTAMKVSSVQVAFKRKSLVDNNLRFNTEFGAGSTFYCGEENILLSECLRAGLKLYFVPVKIADVYMGDSSWFAGFNERYFNSRGAAFTAMSNKLSIPLIVQFALRKRGMYMHNFSFFQVLRFMLNGRQMFLRGDC